MDALIECRNLRHAYGEKQVLHGLSFKVEAGGVFGLLGKNGAGKSTTIDILMGFLRPTGGTCRVLGERSHALSPQARSRIGLLHEGFIQYDFMSIAELERYYAPFYPKWDKDIFYDMISRLKLPHDRKISRMSCGQRSQVVLGLIVAQKPRLMILDDYSMGLDVGYRRLFIDFLGDYARTYGTTIVITSHVVQELDPIIDNMIVLKEGRVCVSGSKQAFMDTFRCYRFERSEASETLRADTLLSNVEQTSDSTVVYGFLQKETLQNHLAGLGVPHPSLQEIPMNFEDAFIGLTGKY
jgi:ABC-2 type transport system ATP-binding protein